MPPPDHPRSSTRSPRRASLLAVHQADDDIFVQPQLLHAHAALLLERMHRGAEHLVAGVFEYYSWMPQVAASHAPPSHAPPSHAPPSHAQRFGGRASLQPPATRL